MKHILSIRTLIFESPQYRHWIFSAIFCAFIMLFTLFHDKIDYIVNLYYGIPIILATYYYGFSIGLLFLISEALIHIGILICLNEKYSFIYQNTRILIAFLSILIVMYIVSLFRKVKNDLKLSEERYKTASEELHRLNATKDKFFSIIAHDLRSPISSINTNIDFLIESKEKLTDQDQNKILSALQSMSTRVFNLLENLLKWAMIQKDSMHIELKQQNIKDICDECVSLFLYIAKEKNINITNCILDNYIIIADKNAIDTVIRNILSNAIKFTNESGTITINAEEKENFIYLKISDNGVGMNENLVKKLFKIDEDVISKGTNGERGTGLGLILCKDLISKCNGTITVESIPNVGSTFIIGLPKS